MLRLFYGDNRQSAKTEISKLLGPEHEQIDGEQIHADSMSNIFAGFSLFATENRRILIRDLGLNDEAWGELPKYTDTTHDIIVWENVIDKRTSTWRELQKSAKSKLVDIREFAVPPPTEARLAFSIFADARSGNIKRALSNLDQTIAKDPTQDPHRFFGLLVSQAIKESSARSSANKTLLKTIAQTDIQLKTTGNDPWLLVKSLLVRLSSL
jgi:hypothetical protein